MNCVHCGVEVTEENRHRIEEINNQQIYLCTKCITEVVDSLKPGDHNNEVKVYVTHRKIGDSFYGEQICARSWKEAEEVAAKIGATVDGLHQMTTCAICGEVWVGEHPEASAAGILN